MFGTLFGTLYDRYILFTHGGILHAAPLLEEEALFG
jgi:hypothetical protein